MHLTMIERTENIETIETLLELYCNGESTLEQERTLEEYFCSADKVPARLEWARALFEHNAQQRAAECPNVVIDQSVVTRYALGRRMIRRMALAITSVAAIVTVGVYVWTELRRPYALINGERVYDVAQVVEVTTTHLASLENIMPKVEKGFQSVREAGTSTSAAWEIITKHQITNLLNK